MSACVRARVRACGGGGGEGHCFHVKNIVNGFIFSLLRGNTFRAMHFVKTIPIGDIT